jgi:hypothetical protein
LNARIRDLLAEDAIFCNVFVVVLQMRTPSASLRGLACREASLLQVFRALLAEAEGFRKVFADALQKEPPSASFFRSSCSSRWFL